MTRLNRSIAVGLLSAVILTWIRGGWSDAPYVVLEFAATGFLVTYGASYLIHADWLVRLESSAASHSWLQFFRDLAALLLIVGYLFWSGSVIQGAGFAGWLVAIFLGVTLPLLTCVLAAHFSIVFGILTATAISLSTLLNHPQFRQDPFAAEAWQRFFEEDFVSWAIIWGILSVLSLVTSVPLTIQRRRLTRRWSPQ